MAITPSFPLPDDIALEDADFSLIPLSRRPILLAPNAIQMISALHLRAATTSMPDPNASVCRASVIVVTFNGELFTRLCLASVIQNPDFHDCELIVIDNGSSDQTPQLLKALAASNPSVRILLNPENRGFASANTRACASPGEACLFC